MLRCSYLTHVRRTALPLLSSYAYTKQRRAYSDYLTLPNLLNKQLSNTLRVNERITQAMLSSPSLSSSSSVLSVSWQQRRYHSSSNSSSTSSSSTPSESGMNKKEAQRDTSDNSKTTMCNPTELVIGNKSRGIHESKVCRYTSADFIGHLHPSLHIRANAGDILALIDICAARSVYSFVKGAPQRGTFNYKEAEVSIGTIAFNSFTFSKPVFEGDLIVLEGFIVYSGNSSIGAHISVSRQSYDSPTPTLIGESFVTMITVERNNIIKPVSGLLPAVKLTSAEEITKYKLYIGIRDGMRKLAQLSQNPMHWVVQSGNVTNGRHHNNNNNDMKEKQKELKDVTMRNKAAIAATTIAATAAGIAALKNVKLLELHWKEIELPENVNKPLKLQMSDTITHVSHTFGIEHVNINNSIFGGEILRFMELCALHCGRTFARFRRLYTLAMNDMQFTWPIYMNELVQCTTMVSCVRKSTLLVNVIMYVGEAEETTRFNRASFILIALDTEGNPVELNVGLDLSHAGIEELQSYWCASQLIKESSKRRPKS